MNSKPSPNKRPGAIRAFLLSQAQLELHKLDAWRPLAYFVRTNLEARMTIQLKGEHQQWLTQQVAAGRFVSVDVAVVQVIKALWLGADDDERAKPFLAEADAPVASGETVAGDVFLDRLDSRDKKLRRRGRPVARRVAITPIATGRRIGIAKGKFQAPDDINEGDDSIAAAFDVPWQ